MKKSLFYISFIIALVACSSQKEVAESKNTTPQPEWVASRPQTGMYYIGIGVAQKVEGTDFRSMAKENALSDLASEIKVNVNANSLLYTLEREYKFEQEFRETIRTSTNIDLEDFESVDQWEDDHAYWVYYRLNKSDYASRQREKKEAAQSLALDFLAKAEAAERESNYSAAIDYYLRGLQAMESFWGEKNEATYRDQLILVDNTLFGGLKNLLSGVTIKSEADPVLNFSNGFQTEVDVVVSGSEGKLMQQVPLEYSYQGEYGRIRGLRSTNADGRVTIPIEEAAPGANTLNISVNTESLFEPFERDRFMRQLTESLNAVKIQIPLRYEPPVVFISSKERNLGETMKGRPIASAVSGSFNRKGYQVTDNPKKSDLMVEIESDSRKGGTTQGFSMVRLDVSVSVRNSETGEEVYRLSKNDIKGLDLDFERAGRKAYQNFTKNIESELMRKLTTDLF